MGGERVRRAAGTDAPMLSGECILKRHALYTAIDSWEETCFILDADRMAEEMLSGCNVFGGHSCRLCMAQQERISFSDYGGVSLEYVHKETSLIFVPFYVFRK